MFVCVVSQSLYDEDSQPAGRRPIFPIAALAWYHAPEGRLEIINLTETILSIHVQQKERG